MPRIAVGDDFHLLLKDAEAGNEGVYGFQLLKLPEKTVVIARTVDGITDLGNGSYDYTGSSDDLELGGVYMGRWDRGTDAEPYADDTDDLVYVVTASEVAGPIGPWFASADDVAERLGRELTDAETAQVEGILALVDGLIRDQVDRGADWAPDPVPVALKEISIQKALTGISNPSGLAGYTESLGAHSYSARFTPGAGGVFISDEEGRALRLAVYGTNAGSSSPRSMIDRVRDLNENRDVDEPET